MIAYSTIILALSSKALSSSWKTKPQCIRGVKMQTRILKILFSASNEKDQK